MEYGPVKLTRGRPRRNVSSKYSACSALVSATSGDTVGRRVEPFVKSDLALKAEM